jgi:hypothetical protein
MQRRVTRALFAGAATAALATSAGLAGAARASASPVAAARPAIKTVIDTNFAGYLTTGHWRFRFVSADVLVAKCRKTANQNASARIALRSRAVNDAAHIDLFCGGGRRSVRFGTVTHREGMLRLSPRVGDTLRVSVFRDRAACRDRFTATNTRSGRTVSVTARTPCGVVYRHAEVGAILTDISGNWRPPAKNVRLWKLQKTTITSYNGTHGTICEPWSAEKHLAAPVIAIRMIPSAVTNKCRDFSVLLKGRS